MEEETFFRRNGIMKLRSLFLMLFILEMVVYFVMSFVPYSNPGLVSQLQSEESSTYSLGVVGILFSIFPHNLLIATIEIIPFLGQFFFAFSIIETPLALTAVASSTGVPGILAFISLLLIPDTIIELPSYAVATATSIYLIYILIKSRGLIRAKIRKVFYMYLFTALELFVAGTFESIAIDMAQTLPSPESLTYTLLLWIPAVPVIYLLFRLFRRINRDEYTRKKKGIPESFEFQ